MTSVARTWKYLLPVLAVTWNGGLFHSYVVNIAYNLVAGGLRAGESPPWQFLWWLALARGYRSASIRAPASSSSFSLVSKPVQVSTI